MLTRGRLRSRHTRGGGRLFGLARNRGEKGDFACKVCVERKKETVARVFGTSRGKKIGKVWRRGGEVGGRKRPSCSRGGGEGKVH